MRGWTKVFAFVFRHQVISKGYIATTALVTALLLTVIPFLALILTPDSAEISEEIAHVNTIERAVVVEGADTEAFFMYFDETMDRAATLDEALEMVSGEENSVVVLTEGSTINVLIPDGSAVGYDDAQALGDTLGALVYAMSMPEEAAIEDEGGAAEIIGFIIPYVTLMLMYFMVLIYAQGVANAAIVEKTSKLMDLFLVSIRPQAVMLGKTLAIALSGIIQVSLWLGGAVGGIGIAAVLTERLHPGVQTWITTLVDALGGLGSMFDPFTIAVSVGMIIVGFILYCALSAVGGALASKPEDLSSTNVLFSMALVISFLLCMLGGDGGMLATDRWMNFVPFTAILAVPGRLITGAVTAAEALVSVGITAVCAFVLVIIAGKAYTLTAFYRGEAIKPVKFITGLIRKR